MKRTAAIVSALLLLGLFLPAVSAYAALHCAMPCHPTPSHCHHQAAGPSLGVPCNCGHDRDIQVSARVENEKPAPVTAVAIVALAPIASADPGRRLLPEAGAAKRAGPLIFCLTRSYLI